MACIPAISNSTNATLLDLLNATASNATLLAFPSVLDRIQASNLGLFFSILCSLGALGAALLAASAAALWRSLPQLLQAGWRPPQALTLRQLGAVLLLSGLGLLVLGGIVASAAVPPAAFMGLGVILMLPGLALLLLFAQRMRTLGPAVDQDAAALGAGWAGLALVLAWEAGVAGLGTLDSRGVWVYNFHAVGWVGLNASFVLVLLVYTRLLSPRGVLEPRALAALALQWHRLKASGSASAAVAAAHGPATAPAPGGDAPLVHAFLLKGRLPRSLKHTLQEAEGYSTPRAVSAPAAASAASAAAAQEGSHLTALPLFITLYLLSLAAYSAVHYTFAPTPERLVGGVLAAALCILDASLLACLSAGILDSPAPPLLASFGARILLVAFPASCWLMGLSSLFAVLACFLGRVVLQRALLEGQGAWGAVSVGALKAEGILLFMGAAFITLFSMLLRSGSALPLPPIPLPGFNGALAITQTAYAYSVLAVVVMALLLELCVKLWLWRAPLPLPTLSGAGQGGVLPRPAREWTTPGLLLVALTLLLCSGLGVGFAFGTGVWFAIPTALCAPLYAFSIMAWYGRWVNDGFVWWVPSTAPPPQPPVLSASLPLALPALPASPSAMRRNLGNAAALGLAAAALAAYGLSWHFTTPPLPSPSPCAPPPDPFSSRILPYLGYATSALVALLTTTTVAIVAYFGTLTFNTGTQLWAATAGALYVALLCSLATAASVWTTSPLTLMALSAATAAYPGLVALLVAALCWLDRDRKWQALPRALRVLAVVGGAWVTAVLAVGLALSSAADSGTGTAPSCALAGWLALACLVGLRVWVDGRPPGLQLPRQVFWGAAGLGGLCVAGAIGLAAWEWVVQRSLLRAVLAASSVHGVVVACLLGAGLLQLQSVGAFTTLLKLPLASEAMRARLASAFPWGAAGSGGGGSVMGRVLSGVGLQQQAHAQQQQQQQQQDHLPPAALMLHKAALSSYQARLAAKDTTALLAESSEVVRVTSGLSAGEWCGAAPLAKGRRLLVPGTLLPAYSYDPQVGRLQPASYGILLVLAAALLLQLWAIASVVVITPTLVGLLVSIATRTLTLLFLLHLLFRAAAETQCALSLMATHLGAPGAGSVAAAAAAVPAATISPPAANAAILDQLLELVLDELGVPMEGREGGSGVDPYPYFSVFPSFAHAARLAMLQRRLLARAKSAVREQLGAVFSRGNPLTAATAASARFAHSPWAAANPFHAGAAATAAAAAAAAPNAAAEQSAAEEGAAAAAAAEAATATPLLERLASPTQRQAYVSLHDLPEDMPLPTLVTLASALEEEVAAALAKEERLALGFLHRLLKAAELAESKMTLQWYSFLVWAAAEGQRAALASLGIVELGHYLGLLKRQALQAGAAAAASAAAAAAVTIPTGSLGEHAQAPPAAALVSKAALLHYLSEVHGPGKFAERAAALQAAEAMHAAFTAAAGGAAAALRAREREVSEARGAAELAASREQLRLAVAEAQAKAEALEQQERARREAARAAEAAQAAQRAEAQRAERAFELQLAEQQRAAALSERTRLAAAELAARQAEEKRLAGIKWESEQAAAELGERQLRERQAIAKAAEEARRALEEEGARLRALHEAEEAAGREQERLARAAQAASEEREAAARRKGLEEASFKALLEQGRGEYERALHGDDSASVARMAALLAGKGGAGWVDPELPHTAASLPAPPPGSKAGGRGVAWLDFSRLREDERAGGSKYVWGSQPKAGAQAWDLGLEAARPEDPGQGQLGDCWLITAMSLFSTRKEYFSRVFQLPSGGGRGALGVRLWGPSGWKEFVLDTAVPSSVDAEGLPLFCRPPNLRTLWPLLLEKAFARSFGGSYSALDGGQIVTALCALIPGSVGSYEETAEYKGREDVLWCSLKGWRGSGHILGASSQQGTDHASEADLAAFQHIVKGHAFAILDVREVVDGGVTHRLLQLRNPWGNTEWDGPYSDAWEGWWDKRRCPTSLNLRVYGSATPNVHPALAGAAAKAWDDGIFYMPFSAFLTHFAAVNVCRVFPLAAAAAASSSTPAPAAPLSTPRWHLASLSGVWSCADGSVGGIGWDPMNDTVPRFKLSAPLRADLFIVLRVVLPLATPPGASGRASKAIIRLCIEEAVEGKLVKLKDSYLHEVQTFLELDTRHVQGGGRSFLISAGCEDKLTVYSASGKATSPTLASLGGSMHYMLSVYSSQPYTSAAPLAAGADAKGKCLQDKA